MCFFIKRNKSKTMSLATKTFTPYIAHHHIKRCKIKNPTAVIFMFSMPKSFSQYALIKKGKTLIAPAFI